MRARRLLTLFVTFLAPAALAAQDAPTPRTDLPQLARVRIHAPTLEITEVRWVTGIVVQTTGACSMVMLDHVGGRGLYDPTLPPEMRILVELGLVDRLEISGLYDGSFIPETHNYRQYREGAPLEGETWIPVDLEAVQAREPAACAR